MTIRTVVILSNRYGEHRVPEPTGTGGVYADAHDVAEVVAREIYRDAGFPLIKVEFRDVIDFFDFKE